MPVRVTNGPEHPSARRPHSHARAIARLAALDSGAWASWAGVARTGGDRDPGRPCAGLRRTTSGHEQRPLRGGADVEGDGPAAGPHGVQAPGSLRVPGDALQEPARDEHPARVPAAGEQRLCGALRQRDWQGPAGCQLFGVVWGHRPGRRRAHLDRQQHQHPGQRGHPREPGDAERRQARPPRNDWQPRDDRARGDGARRDGGGRVADRHGRDGAGRGGGGEALDGGGGRGGAPQHPRQGGAGVGRQPGQVPSRLDPRGGGVPVGLGRQLRGAGRQAPGGERQDV